MGERVMRWLALILMTCGTAAWADHELDGRDIVAGGTLYTENCASCHGTNLEGQPSWQSPNSDGVLPAPPHDATGHTWHHDNMLLFDYTKLGGKSALELMGVADFKSGMPAFEGVISDEEIWNILAYIHSTWSDREKEVQADRNETH